MKKNLFILSLIATFVLSFTSAPEQKTSITAPNNNKIKTIVIDAGHGGKDPGCLGKRTKEAVIALSIATELGKKIKANYPDVKVLYTRLGNTFVPLGDRAALANDNSANLFISIHCNSGPSAAYGVETYTLGLHKTDDNLSLAKRENASMLQESDYKDNYDGYVPGGPMEHILLKNMQNESMNQSVKLAESIQNNMKTLGRHSRGVHQAGFVVLWKTHMPSVLVEVGFLTNYNEETYLNTYANRQKMASAIYKGFKSYKSAVEQ